MKKVIFLDIDGVLNDDFTTKETTPNGFLGINNKFLILLKEIVDKTKAELVLVSDWKECFDTDDCDPQYADIDGKYLIEKLKQFGLTLVEKTKDHSRGWKANSGRPEGIKDYINKHPEIERWIVLDDFSIPYYCGYTDDFLQDLQKNHYITNEYPLTPRTVAYAIEALNS